jgi:uncharacterized protein YndB with AHSA1/START domain
MTWLYSFQVATNERRVSASPEQVFGVLADGWLYPTWVVGASRMRTVDSTWPAVEARLHHSVGVWPLLLNDETRILEWQPPRRAVMEAKGWPFGTATVELEVTPHGSGCTVRITENPRRGPGVLVPKPLRDPLIKIRNTETLRRLAFLAEGDARPGSLPAT